MSPTRRLTYLRRPYAKRFIDPADEIAYRGHVDLKGCIEPSIDRSMIRKCPSRAFLENVSHPSRCNVSLSQVLNHTWVQRRVKIVIRRENYLRPMIETAEWDQLSLCDLCFATQFAFQKKNQFSNYLLIKIFYLYRQQNARNSLLESLLQILQIKRELLKTCISNIKRFDDFRVNINRMRDEYGMAAFKFLSDLIKFENHSRINVCARDKVESLDESGVSESGLD